MKTKPKKPRGKQHPAHAASFTRIAKALRKHGGMEGILTPGVLARFFETEAKRLRKVVR